MALLRDDTVVFTMDTLLILNDIYNHEYRNTNHRWNNRYNFYEHSNSNNNGNSFQMSRRFEEEYNRLCDMIDDTNINWDYIIYTNVGNTNNNTNDRASNSAGNSAGNSASKSTKSANSYATKNSEFTISSSLYDDVIDNIAYEFNIITRHLSLFELVVILSLKTQRMQHIDILLEITDRPINRKNIVNACIIILYSPEYNLSNFPKELFNKLTINYRLDTGDFTPDALDRIIPKHRKSKYSNIHGQIRRTLGSKNASFMSRKDAIYAKTLYDNPLFLNANSRAKTLKNKKNRNTSRK